MRTIVSIRTAFILILCSATAIGSCFVTNTARAEEISLASLVEENLIDFTDDEGTINPKTTAVGENDDPLVPDEGAVPDTEPSNSLARANITIAGGNVYTGREITPSVSVVFNGTPLVKDVDYTLHYSNNTHAGTATVTINGMGPYVGSKQTHFAIGHIPLSQADIQLNKSLYIYDGSAKTPEVKVSYGGTTINNSEYMVEFSNNIAAGTASVTVTATASGNYSGHKTKQFEISRASISLASVYISDQDYTGSAIAPDSVVKIAGKTLTKNFDYSSDYANNTKIGTAKATITGIGNYEGSVSTTFNITKSAKRLSGLTRFGTMAAISSTAFTTAETVIIASGEDFPDALGASALAGAYNAPILLSASNTLSAETRTEINRLGAHSAIIVGGEAAISSTVYNELRNMGLTVNRFYGQKRQETALTILGELPSVKTVIIASGSKPWDSLSISSYAYAKQIPILLTEANGTLSDEAISAIKALGSSTSIIIVGGAQAVASKVESQLAGYRVERWCGNTRYETSLKIASKAIAGGLSPELVAVASGENFPDALAGSALIGKLKGTVVLCKQNDASTPASFIKEHKESTNLVYILGGTQALSSGVEDALRNLL